MLNCFLLCFAVFFDNQNKEYCLRKTNKSIPQSIKQFHYFSIDLQISSIQFRLVQFLATQKTHAAGDGFTFKQIILIIKTQLKNFSFV